MPETANDPHALLWSHRYGEAVVGARRRLDEAPNDLEAVGVLARALVAQGNYEQAMPQLERLDEIERADPVVRGRLGRRIELACLHWMLGETDLALSSMRKLAEGILDHSIQYGDNAGGVTQGNLLYYMAVTEHDSDNAEFALKYLRSRAKRMAIQSWPGPVARYYLEEVDFGLVLAAATGEPSLDSAVNEAKANLRKRRDLCVALFHDGVRHRAKGQEAKCLERMRQCSALENPIIESEWYLARHELKQVEGKSTA